jgi:hypothetical protein
MVRMPNIELAALDAWIAAQPVPVTRPEAIRQILRSAIMPT